MTGPDTAGRKTGPAPAASGERPGKESPAEIARYLKRSDPRLARVIERVGPKPLPKNPGGFPHLARAIIFQQISGAAGRAILGRLHGLHGGDGFPPAAWFLSAPPTTLRKAGVSPQKSAYLKDLASHVVTGRIDFRRLRRATDAVVVEALTAVHGIGEWTAQMYLIFSLNRPDVLPVRDLGIRKAVRETYGFRALPAESTVTRLGRPWAPYRSHASVYLWRSLG